MKLAVDGQQMKALDQRTVEKVGLPSLVLMERAALACVEVLKDFPLESVLVVCGSGNNGADGIAIARLLHLAGRKAAYFLAGSGRMSEEMKTQLKIAENCGTTRVQKPEWDSYTTIVDAVIGIGLDREVRQEQGELFNRISGSSARILSVDIPSGIHSRPGQVMGTAGKADATVTFGYKKNGIVLYPGASYAGKVTVADIGIYGAEQLPRQTVMHLLTEEEMSWIPERPQGGNKGTFGKVLLLAGSKNMSGAAYLAAKAAFRTGCGMVRIATVPENREILQCMLPEAMLENGGAEAMEQVSAWADVLAAGPGLGQSPEALQKLKALLAAAGGKPVVLDGDALNLLAKEPELKSYKTGSWILTPHPGELGRLLGKGTEEVLADLPEAARQLAAAYGCIAVCKDAATVCALPDGQIWVNTAGNDGMATAGSGDVLAGTAAGLLALGMEPERAAPAAVLLHGKAGDLLAKESGRAALMAGELPDQIGRVLKRMEKGRRKR